MEAFSEGGSLFFLNGGSAGRVEVVFTVSVTEGFSRSERRERQPFL